MKIIILFVFMFVSILQADRILLPIFSVHGSDKNYVGEEYNEFNAGIGYEYDFEDKPDHRYRSTFLAFNDSYKNLMLSASIGYDYKISDCISIGADVAAVSKKIKIFSRGTSRTKRMLLPYLTPNITVRHGAYSVTVLYTPKLYVGNIHVDSVALFVFGLYL